MDEKLKKNNSFWKSIPGIITKITGLILAIVSLITILYQIGWISTANNEEIKNHISDVCGTGKGCYIICESAFYNKDEAKKRVIELVGRGYNGKAGYLWIPDYDCLSVAQMFQVYIGPYKDLSDAEKELCKYNINFDKTTYGVKVVIGTHRYEFTCDN